MAKPKNSFKDLLTAQKFAELLLYEASGGNLGTEPKKNIENQSMSFGEKRAFLDSLVKIADLKRKAMEDEEVESPFDLIRKSQLNGGGKSGRDRIIERATQGVAD